MLSIFKPAPHKRACLRRRLIRPIADYAGRFFTRGYSLAMPRIIWCAKLCPRDAYGRNRVFHAAIWALRCRDFHRLWFSKFIMGSVSDRSNPRVFCRQGLIPAQRHVVLWAFVPWAINAAVMFVLLFLCGWFEVGWPPLLDVRWFTGGRRRTRRHCVGLELCA